jgi:hypothetical protein
LICELSSAILNIVQLAREYWSITHLGSALLPEPPGRTAPETRETR